MEIGDKVRLKNGTEFEYQRKEWTNNEGVISGLSIVNWWNIKSGDYENSYPKSDLELIETQKLIIHCPTRELFERVLEKLRKRGYKAISALNYNKYKDETSLRPMDDDKLIYFGDIEYYRKRNPDHTFLSAEEYLIDKLIEIAKANSTSTTLNIKPKQTIMETIKNGVLKLTKDLENRLKRMLPKYHSLYRAGYLNEDLSYNTKYRERMLELLAEEYHGDMDTIALEDIKEAEAEGNK
jgi:hypothetical protein